MIRSFLSLFIIFSLVASAPASPRFSGGPAQGIWWNASESGRGYNIELQDRVMVVTTYGFDATGNNTWYVSAGLYDQDAGTFQATFDNTTNGQCFGCPYRAPTPRPSAGGALRIEFDTQTTGTLHFDGGSTRIKRQYYGYGDTQAPEFLFGRWAIGIVRGNAIAGDLPLINGTRQIDSKTYATGITRRGQNAPTIVATYDSPTATYFLIVRSGQFDRLYELKDAGGGRMTGYGWILRGNSLQNGDRSFAYATRLRSNSETNGELSSDIDGVDNGLPSNDPPVFGLSPEEQISQLILIRADTGAPISQAAAAFVVSSRQILP